MFYDFGTLEPYAHLPALTRDEEAALAARIQAGDEQATVRLVASALRFVGTCARKAGLPATDPVAPDAIAGGVEGLWVAALRFDPERSASFLTCAAPWVRQKMQAAIDDARGGMPRYMAARVRRVRRILRGTAVPLTPEELLARYNDGLAESQQLSAVSLASVQEAAAQRQPSLDAPIGAEGRTLGGKLPAHDLPADEAMEADELSARLDAMLDGLMPREASILARSFGLRGYEAQSAETIAATEGVSRERIRQLRERALGKLRRLPDPR